MKLFRLNLLLITLLIMSASLNGQDNGHIQIDSVNSAYDEQNPRLSPDGNHLYFTRSGHPDNVGGLIDRGDIWVADKNADGSWSKARHAGNVLNHRGLNGVVGFSADGQTMYLLNYFDPDGQGGGNLRNGIAKSTFRNGTWSTPQRLSITYFANNSEYISAHITPDEEVIVLSIRSFQTYGNEDIYVTFKQDNGTWLQPRNLGNVVNTGSEEWAPFLSADKSTLYFASNGHGGFGSRDIFVSKRVEGSWDNWTEPVNLGAQVNTRGVEMGYFVPANGDVAYFSSTQNSEGFGDLFNYPLSPLEKAAENVVGLAEPVATEAPEDNTVDEGRDSIAVVPEKTMVVMALQVVDTRSDMPLDAIVKLTYGDKEQLVNTAEIENVNKQWLMPIEQGTRVYVEITADGYLNYKEQFIAEATTESLDPEFDALEGFRLTPNTVGTKIRIENVLFERSKATFADPTKAKINLDKLVELLEANPEMEIKLDGHTDNQGNPKLLKQLSLDRVESVKSYLVNKGISGKRIKTEGFGREKPIARNSNEAGRSENRRVEFVIIK